MTCRKCVYYDVLNQFNPTEDAGQKFNNLVLLQPGYAHKNILKHYLIN